MDAAPTRSADRIYDQVKAMACTYRLSPGARVNEVELARKLGVSRTPLREALSRLAAEGFFSATMNKGYSVRALDAAHLPGPRLRGRPARPGLFGHGAHAFSTSRAFHSCSRRSAYDSWERTERAERGRGMDTGTSSATRPGGPAITTTRSAVVATAASPAASTTTSIASC